MKRKIMTCILALIVLVNILIPNDTFAISSSGGYTIEAYNIDMVVNENNTFDITETIDTVFTGSNKHGIFRKLPLRNTVERLDGTKSKNTAKISNINVSEKYTISNENGYKVLKIGDKNKTVSGRKRYIIKYNYNIGKDPLKNADELYYNLIGNEWDTGIKNITFKITMPKPFDKSKLGFSHGYKTSTSNANIQYNVSGNIISGSLEGLHSERSLTVRLTLPEGYFVGASSNIDIKMLIGIAFPIIFVIIAYILWCRDGKDDEVIETVEFYPPEGLNSADVGFISKGYSEQKDIISLLIYLANKGYLRIEESTTKGKKYKIIKVREYDGNNNDEKTFFDELFMKGDIVTRSDLYDKFYLTLQQISNNINRKENKEKIFEKASLKNRIILIGMILIIFLSMIGGLFITGFSALTFLFVYLVIALINISKNVNVGTIIITVIAYLILFFTCFSSNVINGVFWGELVIKMICIILLTIFLCIIKKRTPYGNEMLGKIRGFKNFLEVAEKPKLEELVMQDPEYFYNILPYTYVLGVSSKWMKKFEDIALKAPDWYSGYTYFDSYSFNRFMNSTYSSISRAMSSSPSSSSSGGGSSGGGFSGGGSGGGGGGSW